VRDRWQQAPEKTQTRLRVLAVLGMVVAAYHYSLLTLAKSLSLETPLAYVGLAPLIALLLAGLRARMNTREVPVYDRQVDYIIGVPLLAVAVVVNTVFRTRLSTMFWVWRVDMFSMPFFVAGAVCVVFGVRTMWRQKAAIAFLFLAWPYLYQVLLLRFLDQVTNYTIAGVRGATGVIGVAHAMPGSDGSLFQVWHQGRPFEISVASACSGVNGMVGFLLVGVAFAVIVRGPLVRKVLWLAGGLTLLWAINVARILFIFWTGRMWGEKVAIDVFHPFVGLVTFSLGVVVMVLALRLFRLRIDGAFLGSGAPDVAESESRPAKHSHLVAVPKVARALILVTLVSVPLAVLNSNLQSFSLVADALGAPRLAAFSDYPAVPPGWQAHLADRYDWAKPYFGSSSTWLRYTLSPGTSPDLRLQSSEAVVADVISTSDLSSFSTYGVEACYQFHGYKLRDVADVELGGGVSGKALSFYNPKLAQDWTVLYWVWPVKTSADEKKPSRFERITLYIQGSGETSIAAGDANGAPIPADPGVKSVGDGLQGADNVTRRLTSVRTFLVEFGREVVQGQSGVQAGTVLPVPATPAAPKDQVQRLLERLRERRAATQPAVAAASSAEGD
jgi:exosortase/archaeosortase family protein